MNRPNTMQEVQDAVKKVLNKPKPRKKKQKEIFVMNEKKGKPVGKPRKELTKGQKQLMKEHREHHTKKHMSMMTALMKQGYCFQQAHDMTMKKVGK